MDISCPNVIRNRRSIRGFSSKTVPSELLMKVIDCALWAPSAGNLQPWHILVVTNKMKKVALAEAALGQRFISEAPVVLVICAEPDRSSGRYGSRGREMYCIQDTANLTYAITLVAESLGLGTCWVGAFHDNQVREVLSIGSERKPVAIVPIGYPVGPGTKSSRRRINEVITLVDEQELRN
ncbi:MAG: nitroreductase family protein [Limnochordia bacterium]|jgi:nitroreductase|nr:nitroreductase family protein [Limnochordia bacterium]MDD4517835.1 nitroreductase family protein [Limnochordia bacterium]